MTKIKRLVAVTLAFLMILGSFSMAAFAWDANVDDGFNLGIETKFFRNVNGDWVETTKVEQGEEIKARVYLSTDYYTNSGNLLLFYNNSFLEGNFAATENTLVVNPFYAAYPYTITGKYFGEGSGSNIESSLVRRNAITQDFADANDFIRIIYYFDATSYNQKFYSDKWFCEFDFTVKSDASTTDAGNLFAVESTLVSPSFTRGAIDVPKGEYNKRNASTVSMTEWNAKLVPEESPVTLFTNKVAVTFNANGGLFDDKSETAYYEGDAGDVLSPEAPKKANSTFKGWAVKGTEEIVDATVYPSGDTEFVAVWDDTTASDGEAVTFETRFYRLDEETGEWVYTEKAKRGEALKARIFINTNYFTNAGDIIVFYNNQFFTDTYKANQKQTLAVNTEAGSAVANNISGEFVKYNSNDHEVQKLVDKGYISAAFAEQHNAYAINYRFDPSTGKKLTVNDWSSASEEWLFEFDVQVGANASGMEYFWIEENTIMNPDEGIHAFINIPVSTDGGENTKAVSLHSINVEKTIDNGFVELDTTLTFNANEGVFAENNSDEIVINGLIGSVVVAPKDPAKDGFTFMGWADEEGNPVDVPATMPYDDATLTAIWQKQVEIKYDTDGDGTVDVTETVTSGQPFVKPADPVKEGYKFIGWGENDPTGATITGIPDVYPGDDTTYTAIFDLLSYEVNYYVRDPKTLEYKLVAEVPIPYGELIAHKPSTAYKAPEGYALSEAYSNASLTTLLADDATMPASAVDVYFKLVPVTVTVTFDALEGAWADGDKTKNVDVVYDTQIEAPEDPVREGYNFLGWTPDVEIMEDIDENYFMAIWEEATYYATFKVDDAVHAKFDHFMGEVIDTPDEPYKEGYTFVGWSNFTEGVTTMPAEDVEFIAVFEVNKYDATFDAGEGFFGTLDAPETDAEGNVVTEKTEEVAFGSDINDVLPADPVREGYTFGGWDPVPGTMPNEDTTYTATWNPNTDTPYTVEIYTMDTTGAYGEPVVQNKTGTTGTLAEVTTNAAEGMYVDEETEKTPEKSVLSAEILPDGSTVLKVYYARNEVKVTFDAKGGKLSTAEGEAEKIVLDLYYGATVAAPADPTLTGNTFKGWEPAVVGKALEDATYTAKWEVNEYTITFNTDGGSEIAPITGKYGDTIEVPEDPTKTGYTFDGWVDAEDKPATVPTEIPAKDIVLTATWVINNYDISIDANGGKLADGSETYAKADVDYSTDLVALGVPMTVLDREGYTFLGWSENKDATEAEFAEIPATMPADDIIWYAVWEINSHSITFDTDGGTEISPITGNYGDTIEVPADPTKEGYTFDKWVDADGNPADVPETMPDEDVVLKATWKVNSYKVVYKSDDEEVASYDVDYGASIPVPAVPTKTGYTFGGWYETESGKANTDYATMPAEDLEFAAKWNNIQGIEYYFDVYKMGVDGKYPATPDRSTLIGEANSTATVKYTAPTGFKLESYKLSDTISADINNPTVLYAYVAREEYKFTAYLEEGSTETVAEGTYLYEAPIAPVADPERDGYVFDGWVDADGNEVTKLPTSMPAGEVTVYATWIKDAFDATFDAGEGATFPGGSQTVTDPTEFDAPIKAPADDPVKDGYDFVGWAPADDPENVITDGDYGKMDADGEEFVAVWEKATYKVTFYDYLPADSGKVIPAVKNKIVSADYDYEAKIIFPAEVELYGYENYIFMGWTLAENKPLVTDDYTEEMLANLLVDPATETADFANANENGEINYYAVYKRVKVMLIPKNDTCTTVIDRNGGTVDDYVDGESIWYVYGLEEVIKEADLLANFIDVQGDGRIEIILRDGITNNWTGTGTVINVYDNITEELVESFYIVIFGDLNGDSYITAIDTSIALDETLYITAWSDEYSSEYAPYMVKAADLVNQDGIIYATDVAIVDSASLGLYEIFQTDGTYKPY